MLTQHPQAPAKLKPLIKPRQPSLEAGAIAPAQRQQAQPAWQGAGGPQGLWLLWWLMRGSAHPAICSRTIAWPYLAAFFPKAAWM